MKKSLSLIFLVPVLLGQGCFSNQAPSVSPAPQEIQETPAPAPQPMSPTLNLKTRQLKTFGSRPSPRQMAGVAYDSEINSLYVFGGRDSQGYKNDLYVLDLATGGWDAIGGSGPRPSPRAGMPLMINAKNSSLYIFGGQNIENSFLDDFWRFDLSNRTWEKIDKTLKPEGRYGHAGIFDEKKRDPVIFGGFVGGGRSNETWAFQTHNTDASKDQWVNISPAEPSRPQARCLLGYSHAADDDSLWIFGGQSTGIPGGKAFLGDFWHFDLSSNQWQPLKVASGMGARHWGGLAALKDQIVLFGGQGEQGVLNDLWVYDKAAAGWASYDGSQIPGRTAHSVVADVASNRAIVFGGEGNGANGASGLLNDVWFIELGKK